MRVRADKGNCVSKCKAVYVNELSEKGKQKLANVLNYVKEMNASTYYTFSMQAVSVLKLRFTVAPNIQFIDHKSNIFTFTFQSKDYNNHRNFL